jgi:outer membrane protein OmpA-like peptidoglycan-associated protein
MKNISLKILVLLVVPSWWLAAQTSQPINLPAPPSNGYTVENVEELNSQYLDYCAVGYRDGVMFTSGRGGKGVFVCDGDLVTGRYSDLYFAKADAEGRFFAPEMLYGDVNGKYHDGTATFTPDGETMIFTRNNKDGQNKAGMIDLKIYSAKRKKGDWVNSKELPFNSPDYATCHPSLTADGTLLFFSSNRPGGYGGMDLYVVKKLGDDWGVPVNLGPEVNTMGHDIFPFIAADGTLYFSSDGHAGYGGLDVYSVKMDGMTPSNFTHLPTPINSQQDDFGFTSGITERTGYLTSNRPGGKGQDDIYRWKFNGVKPVMASICVVEKSTGVRIDDANLRIRPLDMPGWGMDASDPRNFMEPGGEPVSLKNGGDEPMPAFSKSCEVQMPVLPGNFYLIEVNKKGYLPVKLQVSANEMMLGPEFLVPIEKLPIKTFTGVVRDQGKDTPLAASTVKVRNTCTGQILTLQTDASGSFNFNFDCRCDYEVVAEKPGFDAGKKLWKAAEMNCDEDLPAMAMYLTPAPTTPVLEVGTVIELENVYYDYDRYFIRSDAAADLDHVVDLMKKYPSLEIELGSHTDARGSDSYNLELSQKRADAAVVYIISKGIDARRLKAKGYGETQLVNRCANGVPCSDEEHQQNRRTEIKITRLEEKGVRY